MLTSIHRKSLETLLQHYSTQPNDCQLLLMLRNHVIAASHDMEWDESLFTGTDGEIGTVSRNGSLFYFIRTKHSFSDLSIIAILPVDNVMHTMYRLQRMLKTLEIIGILTVLLATVAFYQIICRPLKHISSRMQSVGEGDLSVRMPAERTSELDDVGQTFNGMAERLQQLIDREYRSRLLAAGAEKKALQYQITPHFLYNTYFQLRNLIELEENEQAGQLADLMGRYLRYIVHQDADCATLKEEMAHAKNYADIQSMRFKGRIEVQWQADAEAPDGIIVPRLIIQPLIENAFGHGVKNVEKGGVVRVSLRREENAVTVSVEDNGDSLSDERLEELRRSVADGQSEESDCVALVNIHRRLQLHFGPRSRLLLGRSELGGLKAAIWIVPGERRDEHAADSAGG